MSMKKSPLKKTPEKNLKSSVQKSSLTHFNNASQINSNLYFCHFKNAMYMGGIKAFQKNGKGILLHDNGTNLISSYYNDLLHGHNIFFTNYCFLSAEYSKNKLIQAVYRTDGFLLLVFYNNDGQLDGKSVLLNYVTKSIIYCTFKKGTMLQKQQQADFTVINRVFELGQIDFLIGKKHAKSMCYQFQKQKNLMIQKMGNKLIVGYQKHGLVNGLAFSYSIRNMNLNHNVESQKNQDNFDLTLIQRGYYINGQLNGFGQKIFKNGNSFIGQFKCDVFQGNGILKNSIKRNWVSGHFQRGNLTDLLQYNHQGGEKKYDKILEAFHQKRSNWINNQITLINWSFFDQEIQKIISTTPNSQIKTLEQRKHDVLRKIQENFICQNSNIAPSSSTLRQIQQFTQFKNPSQSDKQSVRKFVRNFIPENQNSKVQKFYPKEKQTNVKDFISSRRKSEVLRQSKISKVNIRKSRIFENSAISPSRSVDSFLKIQRIPVRGEQEKGVLTKNKSLFNVGSRRREDKSQLKPEESYQSAKLNENSITFTGNTSPQKQHDSKRLIGKSRIFNYLNTDQDDITPKFHYNEKEVVNPNKGKSAQQEVYYV